MIVVNIRPHEKDNYNECDIWVNDALKIGTIFKTELGGYTADSGGGHRHWQTFNEWNEAVFYLLREANQIVFKESERAP